MLTDQEKQFLRTAFDAAIKNSPDSLAAANVLGVLLFKLEAMANELQELKGKSIDGK